MAAKKAMVHRRRPSHYGRCRLLLLRTFSAHAKVVARDAKEMRNTQDTHLVQLLSHYSAFLKESSCMELESMQIIYVI